MNVDRNPVSDRNSSLSARKPESSIASTQNARFMSSKCQSVVVAGRYLSQKCLDRRFFLMQAKTDRRTLETLHWDNQSLRRLPVLPAGHAGRVDEPGATRQSHVPGHARGHVRRVLLSGSAHATQASTAGDGLRECAAPARSQPSRGRAARRGVRRMRIRNEFGSSRKRPWLAAWAMANGFCGSQIFGLDTLGVDRITLSLHTWE